MAVGGGGEPGVRRYWFLVTHWAWAVGARWTDGVATRASANQRHARSAIKSMVPIHTLLFTLTALRPTPIFATTTTKPRASILLAQKMPTRMPLIKFTVARRLGMLQISTDNLFERADRDGDGFLSVDEAYEMVLKTYIQVNRWGMHVDPPEKDVMEKLVARAGSHERPGWLTREEFRWLKPLLELRLGVRVCLFVTVRFLIAPLLAWRIVGKLEGRGLADAAQNVLPALATAGGLRPLLSGDFWRAAIMVFLMATLGNLSNGFLNAYLARLPFADAMLPKRE